jgi:hypothetical protein
LTTVRKLLRCGVQSGGKKFIRYTLHVNLGASIILYMIFHGISSWNCPHTGCAVQSGQKCAKLSNFSIMEKQSAQRRSHASIAAWHLLPF